MNTHQQDHGQHERCPHILAKGSTCWTWFFFGWVPGIRIEDARRDDHYERISIGKAHDSLTGIAPHLIQAYNRQTEPIGNNVICSEF